MSYNECMKFEWDDDKNESNQIDHGISFEEVIPLLENGNYEIEYDQDHSTFEEDRWIAKGKIEIHGKVFVVFVELIENEFFRIISARKDEG